jgi:hypothetical protein
MANRGTKRVEEAKPVCPGLIAGTVVHVALEGAGNFRSVCVGMDYGQFLIIKMPAGVYLGEKLLQKNHITIRYIHSGQVFGFRVTLIGLITRPMQLAFLSYPTVIESLNLRNAPRFECSLPVAINSYASGRFQGTIEGWMTDISAGGCSFSADAAQMGAEYPKISENVALVFRMEGHEGRPYTIRVAIRRMQQDSERVYLGLQFAAKDHGDEEDQRAQMAILALCETLGRDRACMAP